MRPTLLFASLLALTSLSGCSLLLDFNECDTSADCPAGTCAEGICQGPPACAARSECAAFDKDAYCLSGLCRTIDPQLCPTLGRTFMDNAEGVIIPIGAAMPLTGENAPKGDATLKGAELALRQINSIAGGSRADARYGLITCDTAYEPARAAAVTAYMHDELGIQGVVGAISSAESIEIVDKVAREKQVLIISPASTSPGLSGRSEYFWRTIASDADQASAMGSFLENQGLDDSVVVLYAGDSDPYGAGFLSGLNTYWASNTTPDPLRVATYSMSAPADSAEAINNSVLFGTQGIRPKTIILIGSIGALSLLEALETQVTSKLTEDEKPTWVLPDALRDQALLDNPNLAATFPRILGTIPSRQDTMIFNNYVALYRQSFMSDPLRYQFPDKAYDAAFMIALAHEANDTPRNATAKQMVQVLLRLTGGQLRFDTIATDFSSAAGELNSGRTISLLGVSGPMQFTTQRDLISPTIVSWSIDSAKKEFINGGIIKEPAQ